MSIISKIKSLLPASSRSLHGMYGEVIKTQNNTKELLREVERANIALFEQSKAISQMMDELKKLYSLKNDIDAFEFQSSTILWNLYRKDDESLIEAKLRFFHSLPKADGALRSHQLRLAELLVEFDKLCKENDIKYFLAIGTLLGALRHDGFVPWDDDVDVGVMREDIDKLIDIVRSDARFKITVVYDQYVFCKQIRFKRFDAKEEDPFIDLFIYEYSNCETLDDLSSVKQMRDGLMRRFNDMNESDPDNYPLWKCVEDDGSSSPILIQETYDEYRKKLFNEGLYADKGDAKSIIWSIENLSFGDPVHIIPIEYFKGMRSAYFEGVEYPILGNSEKLLTQHYNDWLKVPSDIYTHFKHADIG